MASSARSLGRRSGAAEAGSGSCSTAIPRTASERGSHDFMTARSAAFGSACASALSPTCNNTWEDERMRHPDMVTQRAASEGLLVWDEWAAMQHLHGLLLRMSARQAWSIG